MGAANVFCFVSMRAQAKTTVAKKSTDKTGAIKTGNLNSLKFSAYKKNTVYKAIRKGLKKI